MEAVTETRETLTEVLIEKTKPITINPSRRLVIIGAILMAVTLVAAISVAYGTGLAVSTVAPTVSCVSNFASDCYASWHKGGLLMEANLEDSDKCAEMCSLFSGCGFYAYKKRTVDLGGGSLCQLFSTPFKQFLEQCMQFGGPSDGPGPGCADPKPDSCDMFRLGECTFRGSPKESNLAANDEATCVKLAQINHHTGYIYYKESKICDLYGQEQMYNWQKSCPVVYGPPGHSAQQCGALPGPISSKLPKSEPIRDSSALTFGGCHVGQYPIEESRMGSQDACAKFCNLQKGRCKFYSFDHKGVQGQNCKLFDAPFHEVAINCDSVGGLPGESISWPDDLTKVYNAECDYKGTINEISEMGSNSSADHCKKFCKANQNNGCRAWVFTKHNKVCRLMSSPDRLCSVSYGPP